MAEMEYSKSRGEEAFAGIEPAPAFYHSLWEQHFLSWTPQNDAEPLYDVKLVA